MCSPSWERGILQLVWGPNLNKYLVFAVVLVSSFSTDTYREAVRRTVIGAILMLLSIAVIIATSIHEA